MAFDHRRALIEHLLQAAPKGLTLAQIAAQLHPPVPRRTLQYWLMRGEREGRIWVGGLARATVYFLNGVTPRPLPPTPALPAAAPMPVSAPVPAVAPVAAREKVPAEDLIREFVDEQGRRTYVRRYHNPGGRHTYVAVLADTIEPVPTPPAAVP